MSSKKFYQFDSVNATDVDLNDLLLVEVDGVTKKITIAEFQTLMGVSGGDITAPTIVSATATNSTTIRVVFSESVTPTVTGWSIYKQDILETTSASSVTGSGTTWDFTIGGTAMDSTMTLKISYNSSTGNTLDGAGNELATVSLASVTNSIPAVGVALNAPGSFSLNVISGSQINASWTDTNTSPNESGFEIQRGVASDYSDATTINSPAANSTSYNNTGLTGTTHYYYRIRSKGNGTTTTDSTWATANATTLAKPANLVAIGDSITDPSGPNVNPGGHWFEQLVTALGSDVASSTNIAISGTAFYDTTLGSSSISWLKPARLATTDAAYDATKASNIACILLGVNDTIQAFSLANVQASATTLFNHLTALGYKLVVGFCYEQGHAGVHNRFYENLPYLLREWLINNQVSLGISQFVDVLGSQNAGQLRTGDNDSYWTGPGGIDGVHIADTGQDIITALFQPAVQAVLDNVAYPMLKRPLVSATSTTTTNNVISIDNGYGATSYDIYGNDSYDFAGATLLQSGSGTSYTHTGLTQYKHYYYWIISHATGKQDSSAVILDKWAGQGLNYMSGDNDMDLSGVVERITLTGSLALGTVMDVANSASGTPAFVAGKRLVARDQDGLTLQKGIALFADNNPHQGILSERVVGLVMQAGTAALFEWTGSAYANENDVLTSGVYVGLYWDSGSNTFKAQTSPDGTTWTTIFTLSTTPTLSAYYWGISMQSQHSKLDKIHIE